VEEVNVKKFLVVMVLLIMPACGCASTGGALVLTEDAMHDGLAAADDQVRVACTTQPAGEVFKPVCDDIRRTLITAFEAENTFNRCIRDELQKGCATNFVVAVEALITQVKRLPESESGKIIQQLARAVAAAVGRVR
jgi:hypothetical protein